VLCSLYRVYPAGLEFGSAPGCNYADGSGNVVVVCVVLTSAIVFSPLKLGVHVKYAQNFSSYLTESSQGPL